MGVKRKPLSAAPTLAELRKKAEAQVELCERCKVLEPDRIESLREEADRKLRAFLKKNQRSPRFRVLKKTSRKVVLERSHQLKLRELEGIEQEYREKLSALRDERQKVDESTIEARRVEDEEREKEKTKISEIRKETERLTASLAKTKKEIAVLKQRVPTQTQKKTPPQMERSRAANAGKQGKATRPAPAPKRINFIGEWEAVCDGTVFVVNVDERGGVISGQNYSEQFKMDGDGSAKKPYFIQLNVERWELSSQSGQNKLTWLGKASGLRSEWTRVADYPRKKAPSINKGKETAPPQAKARPKAQTRSQGAGAATAPPEQRQSMSSIAPMSPGKRAGPDDDRSELFSDISEFQEPPLRVIPQDPHLRGFPASPEPVFEEGPEPSKTHLQELLDAEDHDNAEPFTKRSFAESSF